MARIAVDFDGTLARSQDMVCKLLNFKFGTSFTAKDVRDWYSWDKIGLDKEMFKVFDLMDSGLRMALEPYDAFVSQGLLSVVKEHDVEIVTANNFGAVATMLEWLRWNAPNAAPDIKINCIGRGPSQRKLDLDYQVYIDDSPELAEHFVGYPNKQLILMNANWNADVANTDNITRCRSWLDVPALVENFVRKTE